MFTLKNFTIESYFIALWYACFNERSSDNLIFGQRVNRIKNPKKKNWWCKVVGSKKTKGGRRGGGRKTKCVDDGYANYEVLYI